MTAVAFEFIRDIALKAAATARRVSPIPLEDLEQEAMVAALESVGSYELEKGPLRPWVWQNAYLRCLHRTRKAIGVRNAEAEELDEALDASSVGEEEEVARRLWRARVRAAVAEIVSAEEADGVLPLILREASAAELAGRRGVRVRAVYTASSELRERLRKSPALAGLWEDRP